MYKDDNKISQQQKILHMNKMLEHVSHFQTSFNVGIQPLAKSLRKHTVCTPLSINQLYILGIFEHKRGTWKHINDRKKNTYGAYQYKRKLNL